MASVLSLFVGVIDLDLPTLLGGDLHQLEIFLISRLPRLLAILCTGVGMSVAGLIMQQLCQNKFVSPTTGATISSAQLGILIALLGTANIANTVSTGLTLRGRELAMLRSVGMEPADLRRMVLLQSLLYALQALAWGLPLAFVFGIGIFLCFINLISATGAFTEPYFS